MMTIRTVIADDESVAREGLRGMLLQEPDIDVVAECANGRELVTVLQDLGPDLVFLDVKMPDMSGFEALRATGGELPFVVIFVTAHDEYALRAFDVHAADYLLKPFTNRRLREALARARKQFEQEQAVELNEQINALLDRLDTQSAQTRLSSYLQRIPVKQRRRVTLVDVADIDWMEAADNYVGLHVGDQTYFVRSTLTEMEKRLDPEQFARVHRSRIVNVERIRELHPRGSGDCLLVLDDGTELLSSRTYSDRRREVLSLSSQAGTAG